jgi:cytochrome c5
LLVSKQGHLHHQPVQRRDRQSRRDRDRAARDRTRQRHAHGAQTFRAGCGARHAVGVGGTPKLGDHAGWGPRIAHGEAALREHALTVVVGNASVMLATGGRGDLIDDPV